MEDIIKNQNSISSRTMNSKFSISILSRALLEKILQKVAFSNLIITFGDSSPMLKSC